MFSIYMINKNNDNPYYDDIIIKYISYFFSFKFDNFTYF